MKTTLNIEDSVMRRLKQEAARRGVTMSWLVESALRAHLAKPPIVTDLPPLPTFNGGGYLVDISNREAMYDAFDKDEKSYKY